MKKQKDVLKTFNIGENGEIEIFIQRGEQVFQFFIHEQAVSFNVFRGVEGKHTVNYSNMNRVNLFFNSISFIESEIIREEQSNKGE